MKIDEEIQTCISVSIFPFPSTCQCLVLLAVFLVYKESNEKIAVGKTWWLLKVNEIQDCFMIMHESPVTKSGSE